MGRGLQAGRERSPLCCSELLSVLILGFSNEAVRNSLVWEEQCPKVC